MMSVIHFIMESPVLSAIACIGLICGLAQIFSQKGFLGFNSSLLQVCLRSLLAVGLVLCFFVDTPAMVQANSILQLFVRTFVGAVTLAVIMFLGEFIGSIILNVLTWVFEDLF